MNKIYDNGAIMLGTVRDIYNYYYSNNCESIRDGELTALIDQLRELGGNTIVAINYEHPMGVTYNYWYENDMIKGE